MFIAGMALFIGFLALQSSASIDDRRSMHAAAIIPALAVLAGRFFVPRSEQRLVVERCVRR